MKVREFMSREVVALRPEDAIQDAARLLVKSAMSVLPVVNGDGSVLGILTEDDLLFQLRKRHLSWWRTVLSKGAALAREYRKAVGTRVRDVMCPAPAPLDPETAIQSAAERLEQAGTGALPVLADGRLVGMVSCRDFVKVVAETAPQPYVSRSDVELIAKMQERLSTEVWVTNRGIHIAAQSGILSLCGLVDSEEEKVALGVMALAIEGCRGVENNLLAKSDLPHRGQWP